MIYFTEDPNETMFERKQRFIQFMSDNIELDNFMLTTDDGFEEPYNMDKYLFWLDTQMI